MKKILLVCLVLAAPLLGFGQSVISKAVGEVNLVCHNQGLWNITISLDESVEGEIITLHFTSPVPAVPVKTEPTMIMSSCLPTGIGPGIPAWPRICRYIVF